MSGGRRGRKAFQPRSLGPGSTRLRKDADGAPIIIDHRRRVDRPLDDCGIDGCLRLGSPLSRPCVGNGLDCEQSRIVVYRSGPDAADRDRVLINSRVDQRTCRSITFRCRSIGNRIDDDVTIVIERDRIIGPGYRLEMPKLTFTSALASPPSILAAVAWAPSSASPSLTITRSTSRPLPVCSI